MHSKLLRFVLVGEQGSGKTHLTYNVATQPFVASDCHNDYDCAVMDEASIMVLDTPGRLSKVIPKNTKSFIGIADAIFFVISADTVYSGLSAVSYHCDVQQENILKHAKLISKYRHPDCRVYVIINKVDCVSDRSALKKNTLKFLDQFNAFVRDKQRQAKGACYQEIHPSDVFFYSAKEDQKGVTIKEIVESAARDMRVQSDAMQLERNTCAAIVDPSKGQSVGIKSLEINGDHDGADTDITVDMPHPLWSPVHADVDCVSPQSLASSISDSSLLVPINEHVGKLVCNTVALDENQARVDKEDLEPFKCALLGDQQSIADIMRDQNEGVIVSDLEGDTSAARKSGGFSGCTHVRIEDLSQLDCIDQHLQSSDSVLCVVNADKLLKGVGISGDSQDIAAYKKEFSDEIESFVSRIPKGFYVHFLMFGGLDWGMDCIEGVWSDFLASSESLTSSMETINVMGLSLCSEGSACVGEIKKIGQCIVHEVRTADDFLKKLSSHVMCNGGNDLSAQKKTHIQFFRENLAALVRKGDIKELVMLYDMLNSVLSAGVDSDNNSLQPICRERSWFRLSRYGRTSTFKVIADMLAKEIALLDLKQKQSLFDRAGAAGAVAGIAGAVAGAAGMTGAAVTQQGSEDSEAHANSTRSTLVGSASVDRDIQDIIQAYHGRYTGFFCASIAQQAVQQEINKIDNTDLRKQLGAHYNVAVAAAA